MTRHFDRSVMKWSEVEKSHLIVWDSSTAVGMTAFLPKCQIDCFGLLFDVLLKNNRKEKNNE